MAGGRRRRDAPGGEKGSVKTEIGEDPVIVSDSEESETELARIRLRERWELASVLNFLNVFEPVIGVNSKISAEEIEKGLIKPDSSLAQLHIDLLKGIPPVSKNLNGSDAWVTVLCKKLAMWWPWVAEGEIPLTATKGEEINRYKELDPTIRLMILKALCEIRADQDDAVFYINDSLKHGTELSCFRKNKIGGDGNGTTYWYDGNTVLGHRLYREINKLEPKAKVKGKGRLAQPLASFQWETLATNLEEFRKIADEFSSSKVVVQAAVGRIVETDAIPVLEKLQKKKDRALKRQKRQEMLLNDSQNSYRAGMTRSCRNRRPVTYTFDEYDRAIKEAIQINQRKTIEDQRRNGKHIEHGSMNGIESDGGSDADTDTVLDTQLRDGSVKNQDSMESDTDDNKLHQDGGDSEENKTDEYSIKQEDDDDEDGNDSKAKESDESCTKKKADEDGDDCKDEKAHKYNVKKEEENDKKILRVNNGDNASSRSRREAGHTRWSARLTESRSQPGVGTRSPGTKNRLRQRPIKNTALDFIVVPDSEDENSSENTQSDIPESETSPASAD